MNSPDPVPTPVTPLPSQWDSAVIRSLAYAGLGLVASVLANIFGWTTTAFVEKGGHVIDAALGFLVIAIPLYEAYRSRKNTPTPPIAGTPGVAATAVREQIIATSNDPAAVTAAIKTQGPPADPSTLRVSALTVVLCAMVAFALMTGGCAVSPTQPLTTAQTIPQKGYAAAGLYSIAQARALDIMRIPEAPAGVKAAIADADAKATPVVLQLTQALKLYNTISTITTGPAGDRLAEAIKRVDELTQQALPLIEALQKALGKAPPPPTARIEPTRAYPALAWSDAR